MSFTDIDTKILTQNQIKAGWVFETDGGKGLINTNTGKRVNSLDELDTDGNVIISIVKTNYTPFLIGGIAILGLLFFMKKK